MNMHDTIAISHGPHNRHKSSSHLMTDIHSANTPKYMHVKSQVSTYPRSSSLTYPTRFRQATIKLLNWRINLALLYQMVILIVTEPINRGYFNINHSKLIVICPSKDDNARFMRKQSEQNNTHITV